MGMNQRRRAVLCLQLTSDYESATGSGIACAVTHRMAMGVGSLMSTWNLGSHFFSFVCFLKPLNFFFSYFRYLVVGLSYFMWECIYGLVLAWDEGYIYKVMCGSDNDGNRGKDGGGGWRWQ